MFITCIFPHCVAFTSAYTRIMSGRNVMTRPRFSLKGGSGLLAKGHCKLVYTRSTVVIHPKPPPSPTPPPPSPHPSNLLLTLTLNLLSSVNFVWSNVRDGMSSGLVATVALIDSSLEKWTVGRRVHYVYVCVCGCKSRSGGVVCPGCLNTLRQSAPHSRRKWALAYHGSLLLCLMTHKLEHTHAHISFEYLWSRDQSHVSYSSNTPSYNS